ncbi:MAG: NAD(P)H-dependent oxidoreductase [Patescibacteria group bacterium]
MLNIKIILASTREGRFGEKPATWIHEETNKKDGVTAELLDLKDYPLPFYNDMVTPSSIKDGAYSNEVARNWAAKIKEADAFIIVTPEYNHSMPGALKNALDSIYSEWSNKPVGFVAYGGVGGARAVEHLRGVVIDLQMAPISKAIHIVQPKDLLDENGNLKPGAFNIYEKRAGIFLDQLIWWANALKAARTK